MVEIPFHRCMTSAEVMKQVRDAFKGVGDVSSLHFLNARQDNTLQVADDQELNGVDVIKLAGCGSLYVKQNESVSADVEHKSAECGNQSSSSASSPRSVETKQLLERADHVVQMLRVSGGVPYKFVCMIDICTI